MDHLKNQYLAERLISGDCKAYDFLMDIYYQRLCAYAQSLCNDHALAEDIVQNVFVRIWVKRKKINPDFSIKSYLYKSVYNEFITQYRKNKPVLYLEKKYFEAIDVVTEIEPVELEGLIKLMNAEIDISTKTVEGHITRAFKILTEKLGTKMEAVLFLLFDFKKQKGRSFLG